jgi:glycosyltransferase involved in cell wall biosynthesis
LISILLPLKKQYRVYFFFPFYHIGGAEKIHAQITQATGGKECIIFFTRQSHNNLFLHQFKKSGCDIKDISAFTDNKWLYFLNLIYRGIISGYINHQQEAPIVFNGQCNFGYKISPWIKRSIPQIELIHALNTFSFIRLPFLAFYKKSVTVSQEIIEKHKALYKPIEVSTPLLNSFVYIMSCINLPDKILAKDYEASPFRVLYVGRGSYEKRPDIAALVASQMITKNLQIIFELLGNVKQAIPASLYPFCIFHGEIYDEAQLNEFYEQAHVLLIPSSTESGPLVFMEAMARGVAIVSTPVGYIPQHIQDRVSGFVTTTADDRETICREMENFIRILYDDRSLTKKIGEHNRKYALSNFGIEKFVTEYKNLFESVKA